MMTNCSSLEDFNELQWHDSKLRSFALVRNKEAEDNVVFDVDLRGISELELTPARLSLEGAIYIKTEVDLAFKSQCSDDISTASCNVFPLKTELFESQFNYDPTGLDGYYLFDIYLCPPSGRIQVLARCFRLEVMPVDGRPYEQRADG